jgi:hypothetical protein
MIKRSNQTVETALPCLLVGSYEESWDNLLTEMKLFINISRNASFDVSSFEVLYEVKSKIPLLKLTIADFNIEARDFLKLKKEIRQDAMNSLKLAQTRMMITFDAKHRSSELETLVAAGLSFEHVEQPPSSGWTRISVQLSCLNRSFCSNSRYLYVTGLMSCGSSCSTWRLGWRICPARGSDLNFCSKPNPTSFWKTYQRWLKSFNKENEVRDFNSNSTKIESFTTILASLLIFCLSSLISSSFSSFFHIFSRFVNFSSEILQIFTQSR